jgi:hypothetical protein
VTIVKRLDGVLLWFDEHLKRSEQPNREALLLNRPHISETGDLPAVSANRSECGGAAHLM